MSKTIPIADHSASSIRAVAALALQGAGYDLVRAG
jgi:hypothetical protein